MTRNDANPAKEAAHGGRRRGGVVAMRRQFERLLPIALLALLLQLLAPVGASWIAAAAVADPLQGVEICHADPGTAAPDQGHDRDACRIECLLCCVLHAGGALDTPGAVHLVPPWPVATAAIWRDLAPTFHHPRSGRLAQARAPPFLS